MESEGKEKEATDTLSGDDGDCQVGKCDYDALKMAGGFDDCYMCMRMSGTLPLSVGGDDQEPVGMALTSPLL